MRYRLHRLTPVGESLLCGSLLFVLMSLTALIQYAESQKILLGEIRQGLLSSAKAVAAAIDGDAHATLHGADISAMNSEAYQQIRALLRRIKVGDDEFTYVYTTIRSGEEDYFFIVDGGDPETGNFSPLMERYMGWKVNPTIQEAMNTEEPVVSVEPYNDDWGTFVSAFAPVTNSAGKQVAVLGIDVDLRGYFQRILPLKVVLIRTLVGSFLIALVMGALVYYAQRPREEV